MRAIVLLSEYDPVAHSIAHGVDTGSDSLVQQHLAEEVDINTIVRRFGITGQMPVGVSAGVFGDFTGIEDFESAVAAVDRARAGFMSLPAEFRDRFGNDPGMLIEYAQGVSLDELDAEVRGFAVPEPVVVPAVVAPGPPVVAPGPPGGVTSS